MKRIALIAVILAILTGCSGGKTVFEGKIIGYNGEYTEFFLVNPEGEGYIEVPFDINEDGTFSAELEFARSEFDARLFVDRFMFCTCVEKGKKYYAEFDITEEGVETEFRFIGEGEKENAFTRDFWNTFGFTYAFLESAGQVDDFASYKKKIADTVDGFSKRIAETGNKPFIRFYEAKLAECADKYTVYYPYLYLSANGEIPSEADYEAYLAENDFKGYSDEQMAAILNEISGNVVYMHGLDMLKVMQIAENTCPVEYWNHFLMTSMLINRLNGAGPDDLEEAYEYYRSVVTDEGLYSQIAGNYEAARALAGGGTAPEIEFADLDGRKSTLADFKGKALYIDFWASWCKPCCEEIPHLEELVQELGNDKDVRCISISIDEDERSWKKRLDEEKPSWPQYIATEKGQESISGIYQITSIPRFVLIDKDGKIITVNAPRPSELDAASLKALIK